MLGAAVGFALFTPLKDHNPAENFGAGAVAIEGLSAVVSLWFGGWVAGRLSPVGLRSTGMLHGFLVWCVVNIIGVLVVTSGAGAAFSGLARAVGGGISLAGKPAAAMASQATDAAKDALNRSQSTVTSFADEAGSTISSNHAAAIRTKRDLGLALTRLFDPTQRDKLAENHAAAVKILVDDAGMSPADAEKTVNDWTTTYTQLQADIQAAKDRAEEKARIEAEQARKELSIVSFASFIAFLLGATFASLGALHGVREARHHDLVIDPIH